MNTPSSIVMSLMLAICLLPGCKSKATENKPVPPPAVATGSAEPAPVAKPVAAAAASGVDPLSVPAVPVPPGKEQNKGPGQTITAPFEDLATSPHKSITGCPGDKVAIVVPERNSNWTVVKAGDALGKPAEHVVKGWLGPGTDGLKFTWVTKEAGEFTIILEDQQNHDKVALDVALFGCD